VIPDDELATVIKDRLHWRPDGEHAATYRLPGRAAHVEVRRSAQPRSADQRYVVSTVRGDRATHVVTCATVQEAISLAERLRLSA
jgi:predicted DNA-binding transcriptional regulator YafY